MKFSIKANKKSKRLILWVISFLLAFVLWLYAAGANETAVEQSYDLISIKYDSTPIKPYNLVVQSISIDTVNVTIMGSPRDLKNVSVSDISAKISLDSITKPGEYKLSVMITTPDKTTLTSQTVETVIVKVDSPSEKSYPIGSDSIELVGWSLESGCHFGTHTVNATRVTVYGPTLEIDTVDKVKIRTASIGNASDQMTVAAEVVLLNKYGDEINSPNLSITMNTEVLTVKLSVFMKKTVPLTVNCKYGYFGSENIIISPSKVVITGSPDAVKAVSSINLADIDETKELTDRTFSVNIIPPNGIYKITTEDGKDISSAEVSIKVSEIEELSISLLPENIVVYSSDSKVALTGADIKIRLANSASTDILAYFTPADIIASVNASSASVGDALPLVLTVSEKFRDSVYILGLEYKVTVGKAPEISTPIDNPNGDTTGEDNPLENGNADISLNPQTMP
ncbi:MAG: hypothetical protein E7633_07080 [Ruminococcaceae bacterium]|nr:hypothetical protein [Oscillospiraceae bacterium]